MKLVNVEVFRNERFAIKKDPDTGFFFISFPVFNGMAEYNEYYRVTEDEMKLFSEDKSLLFSFVEECKAQKHDERLLFKPGRVRGSAC